MIHDRSVFLNLNFLEFHLVVISITLLKVIFVPLSEILESMRILEDVTLGYLPSSLNFAPSIPPFKRLFLSKFE